MMVHPTNRLERRRSAEAKALQLFKPKKINGKKRHKIVELQTKETEDELSQYRDVDLGNYY